MMSLGVYEFLHAGGSFHVALRPNGFFFCAEYAAQATWQVVGSNLYIDWKNYGQYEFAVVNPVSLDGSVIGDSSQWRKMVFLRPFNRTEMAIMGQGFGTVWNFEYEHGSFEVEFRCDGFNHFICETYPAHSHWNLTEEQLIAISFGQYGQ